MFGGTNNGDNRDERRDGNGQDRDEREAKLRERRREAAREELRR